NLCLANGDTFNVHTEWNALIAGVVPNLGEDVFAQFHRSRQRIRGELQFILQPSRKGNAKPLHERQRFQRAARRERKDDRQSHAALLSNRNSVVREQRLGTGHIVNGLRDEEAATPLRLGKDSLVFIEIMSVPLGDRDATKEKVWSILPRQRIRVSQRKSNMRAAVGCADEYRYSRPGVYALEPAHKSIRGIPAYAPVNDFRSRETPKMLMSVNFRVQSGQKREWPRRRDPFRFVLDVINNETIDW